MVERQNRRVQGEKFQGALEMAGGVAHHLNQPLTIVNNLLNEMLVDASVEGACFDRMLKVQQQVSRMIAITRKIAAIKRYESMDYVAGVKIVDIEKSILTTGRRRPGMIKNVLLVDDDREMLLALQEGFARYADSFSVLLAGDGIEALEYLKRQPVSLVVTDLKMPRVDGFELLATIMANFPDIPVIIITGYSTPRMEQLARKGGAVAFVAKPFLIENLARQIISMLRQEADGGTLHNVSSGMFLQLIEMEQKTCTIRLEEKTFGEKGVLFFVEGELCDARVGERQGEIAAYEIFAWDNVSLAIQNDCTVRQNRINKELSSLLLEGARRSDELKAQRVARQGRAPPARIGAIPRRRPARGSAENRVHARYPMRGGGRYPG